MKLETLLRYRLYKDTGNNVNIEVGVELRFWPYIQTATTPQGHTKRAQEEDPQEARRDLQEGMEAPQPFHPLPTKPGMEGSHMVPSKL